MSLPKFLNKYPRIASLLKNDQARRFILIGVGALTKMLVAKLIFDAIDEE